MADEKNEQDNRDRSRVPAGDGYEATYFAKRHKLTIEQAEKRIEKHGNGRATLDAAAEKLGRQAARRAH